MMKTLLAIATAFLTVLPHGFSDVLNDHANALFE